VAISAAEFGAKASSKREVYRFLTHDCGAYLSSYETMTIFHMRDLAAGKRKRINAKDAKVITVPHFEGLTSEKMLEFAAQYANVMEALPIVERERLKLPRDYLANVIYTLVGKLFADWVDKRVEDRHAKVLKEEEAIHLDPEIARIFQASTATSGKSPPFYALNKLTKSIPSLDLIDLKIAILSSNSYKYALDLPLRYNDFS
jgi:hypothetical protein